MFMQFVRVRVQTNARIDMSLDLMSFQIFDLGLFLVVESASRHYVRLRVMVAATLLCVRPTSNCGMSTIRLFLFGCVVRVCRACYK